MPLLRPPPPHPATPTSAFAVAIPIHCLGHHCGVVVVRLCCLWFVLPSPETASVGELSTYSNVGIFQKYYAQVFSLNFAEKE
jgi:hypothetical protein